MEKQIICCYCHICDEPVDGSYIHYGDHRYCVDCFIKLKEKEGESKDSGLETVSNGILPEEQVTIKGIS